VQVIDLLSAVAVAVDDEAVAFFRDALALRKVTRHGKEVADQRLVLIGDIIGGRDALVGNDQNVRGRARSDVAKSRNELVAIDDVGGQLARDDALEKSVHAVAASLAGGRETGNSTIISAVSSTLAVAALKLTTDSLAAHLAEHLLPVYLVSGDEPLLVAEAADAVRARARAAGFSERETHFLERGADWDAVAGSARNLSLFAERRIIEIRLASAKPGVAGGAVLLRLAQTQDKDLLVLVIAPRLDRDAQSANWVKAIEKAGAWVAIWSIDAADLIAWLKARCRRLRLTVDDEALELLAERTEGNLLAAQQELEKLRLLFAETPVTAAQVLASVADSARYDVAQLTEAALAGDAARALHVLAGLRSEAVEPTLVLWAVNKAARDLWHAQAASATGAPMRTWQRHSQALAQGLRRVRGVPFGRVALRAERADRMIKGRLAGDAWEELALLTAEFCTRPLLPLPRTTSNR
jgi:DNA polymerase III subunit delta